VEHHIIMHQNVTEENQTSNVKKSSKNVELRSKRLWLMKEAAKVGGEYFATY
jgi:hypothetical protein